MSQQLYHVVIGDSVSQYQCLQYFILGFSDIVLAEQGSVSAVFSKTIYLRPSIIGKEKAFDLGPLLNVI